MKTLIEKIDAQIRELNGVLPDDWDETEAFNEGLEDAIRIVENHTCTLEVESRKPEWKYCPHCGGRIIEETE